MQTLDSQIQSSLARGYPLVMGILNVTPDSFYDGGRYTERAAVGAQLERLWRDGADLIDIGAESTRPGAEPVPAQEQIARLEPALQLARGGNVPVSVDTTSPEVAEFALDHGATVVNDVSCLRDVELAKITARFNAWLVLMHSRAPQDLMSGFSQWPDDDYDDIVLEVISDWGRAKAAAVAAGVQPNKIMFDPGLGFSKNARQSIVLLRELQRFAQLGCPMLVGPSRKSFLSAIDESDAAGRLGGSVASALVAAQRGAQVLRVHDVREVVQALKVQAALSSPSVSGGGLGC